MAGRLAMLTLSATAVVLTGCSQAVKDYAIVRAGLKTHEQMTPQQRELELERLQVGCIGYVHGVRGKVAGENRGTIYECLEKVGYNKLLKLDQAQSAKSAAVPMAAEQGK